MKSREEGRHIEPNQEKMEEGLKLIYKAQLSPISTSSRLARLASLPSSAPPPALPGLSLPRKVFKFDIFE